MDKDDKKILIIILEICVIGALGKLGFDAVTYFTIEDTIDDLKLVLLLIVLVIILLIIVVYILVAISNKNKIDKARQNNNKRIDELENKMKSTSRNNRNK